MENALLILYYGSDEAVEQLIEVVPPEEYARDLFPLLLVRRRVVHDALERRGMSMSKLELDIRGAVEDVGLSRVIEEVGLSRVIEEIGAERVIRELGLSQVIAEVGLSQVIAEVGLSQVIAEVGAERVIRELGPEQVRAILRQIESEE